MPHNHLSDCERERIAALEEYEILDTPYESEFDDLVTLASTICNVPIAAISLVDTQRQWFKAQVGLPVRSTPRDISFCQYTIGAEHSFVVPDARADLCFSTNPLVTGEPRIRFYAGFPLRSPSGYAIGALCVIDRVPRELTPAQLNALESLSRVVVAHCELSLTNRRIAQLSVMLERERRAADLARAAAEEAERQCNDLYAVESATDHAHHEPHDAGDGHNA